VGTVPDSAAAIRAELSPEARLQHYLDIEAALALTEAELGVIPAEAGPAIAAAARAERVDRGRIGEGQAKAGHRMMPIVEELARAAGEPAGGWVHWGATSQNIEQTGLVLAIRQALGIVGGLLNATLEHLADLAERSGEVLMAGRTHWQHAVPITFGFKVATWADPLLRHRERLTQVRPRLLIAMTGGAVGNFASLGDIGPAVQAGVARRLGLAPMLLPARNLADPFAELVLVLGLLAASGGAIGDEIARLMAPEFGELAENLPDGDIGSSTMPQKRNAKKAMLVATRSAEIRALAPLALDSVLQSHEVDGARYAMLEGAVERSLMLTGDLLEALRDLVGGLQFFPARMRQNLDLTQGLISAEAVMLALGRVIGRQAAHDVVHQASLAVAERGGRFLTVLAADPRVTEHLTAPELAALLDPSNHAGLSALLARETAARVRQVLAAND